MCERDVSASLGWFDRYEAGDPFALEEPDVAEGETADEAGGESSEESGEEQGVVISFDRKEYLFRDESKGIDEATLKRCENLGREYRAKLENEVFLALGIDPYIGIVEGNFMPVEEPVITPSQEFEKLISEELAKSEKHHAVILQELLSTLLTTLVGVASERCIGKQSLRQAAETMVKPSRLQRFAFRAEIREKVCDGMRPRDANEISRDMEEAVFTVTAKQGVERCVALMQEVRDNAPMTVDWTV